MKARKEIELAIQVQKHVYVIAPIKWQMPRILSGYEKLVVFALNADALIDILQKPEKEPIDRIILPILMHAMAKICGSE